MGLQDRIIAYVTASNGLVSLEKLVSVAKPAGFSEGEVLATLSKIGKKLKSTVRGGVVYYQVPPVAKTPTDHLKWVREHYPYPGRDGVPAFVMPWPEWDLGFMFLKTKEERDLFISEMKGRQAVYNKKRYGSKT